MTLRDLAIKYHALESADKSTFQRKARILQSIWREERGFEPLVDGDWIRGAELPLTWAKESLANFLTEPVRGVVREVVFKRDKEDRQLFAEPRIYNHLLSSQPMCFNLFGELSLDLQLASRVFRDLTSGNIRKVREIRFEYSPDRGNQKYLGDHSAFDVFVAFTASSGADGFIGIEVKYHENLHNKASRDNPRYRQVANKKHCFKPESFEALKKSPLQQIWRDHLLACSMLLAEDYREGFFAFLYPRDNTCCADAVRKYRDCLSDCSTFLDWTLEDVCGAVKRHTDKEWIDLFIDRYLAFNKIDLLLGP